MPTEVMPAMILAMTQAKTNFLPDNEVPQVAKSARTYFPETWIWECLYIDRKRDYIDIITCVIFQLIHKLLFAIDRTQYISSSPE